MKNMMVLVPPFRFSTIEHDIYRGGYPTLRNFRFLTRLRLKTIISVVPEKPTIDLLDFCEAEGIENCFFQVAKFTSDVTIPRDMLSKILTIIITKEKAPLYIHCLDGENVTGLIIMMLRKLQHWQQSKTISEFCRFSRDQTIEKEETEYYSTFHEEILIPMIVPQWLWHDIPIQKHPTMKIKYLDDGHHAENNANGSGNDFQHKNGTKQLIVSKKKQKVVSEETEPSRSLQALDIAGLSDRS